MQVNKIFDNFSGQKFGGFFFFFFFFFIKFRLSMQILIEGSGAMRASTVVVIACSILVEGHFRIKLVDQNFW